MKRVLITGIAGFAGSHLTALLLQDHSVQISGIVHPLHENRNLPNSDRVRLYGQDMLDREHLEPLLHEILPDEIYHLAGMAQIHDSWKNRQEAMEANFLGAFYLLEVCRRLPAFPKVLLIGSGDCYGVVPESEQPIGEDRPLVPSSPYAVSKIAQEVLGIQYAKTEGFPVFICRSFNHTGPGQKETFVCSALAKQIARGELKGKRSEIRVGNLTARRDFSDARDVVRAYCDILRKWKPGEPYNVCSGTAVSISEILDTLMSLSDTTFEVVTDAERFRPVDVPLLQGNPAKLEEETGWRTGYSLRHTLTELLNDWRIRLSADDGK